MELMIDHFTKNGTTVITCTLPDLTVHTNLPFLRKHIGKLYINQCNDIINKLSKKYNTIHLDFYNPPKVLDKTNWSLDGIHPNAKGYTEIADEFITLLKKRNINYIDNQ